MARPQKIGLDYFPLDVDMDSDDKVAMIEALHGIEGFGIVVKLLMKIYKEGYFYNWTEKEIILFSKRLNIKTDEINIIVDDCLKWDLFNKASFDNYKILTSKGIQSRYLEIVKRRNRVEIIKEYLLLSKDILKLYTNIVIVDINGVDANINLINDDISTQRKEDSKEKKTVKNKNIYVPVIEYLNQKTGKQFRASGSKTKDLIDARINEGFTLDDFYKVIDVKVAEWLDDEMDKFLRPDTLFSNKFESYLNQKTVFKTNTSNTNNWRGSDKRL